MKYSVPLRYRLRWQLEHLVNRFRANEGEATARAAEMLFRGYPMSEHFDTKEDAVRLLQAIWNVLDDWDGSRINVSRARDGFDVSGYIEA